MWPMSDDLYLRSWIDPRLFSHPADQNIVSFDMLLFAHSHDIKRSILE